MKIGTCTKCGKSGKIVMHHEHGYDEEHDQDVKPYCVSCHRKVHIKARKEGRCTFTPKEIEAFKKHGIDLKVALQKIQKEIYGKVSNHW